MALVMDGPPRAAGLEAALQAMMPPGVAVAVWGAGVRPVEDPPLMPEELAAIRNAVPSRRIEFARGRACAREALRRVGSTGRIVLPPRSDRAPAWPPGHTGSITHAEGIVAAAAATRDVVRALGIDAEPLRPLPEGTDALVLTPDERAFLQSRAGAEPSFPPEIAFFSAKEAVHKAIHPETGVRLDFLDVTLRFDAAGGFRADLVREAAGAAPSLALLVGHVRVVHGIVLAGAWLPPEPAGPGGAPGREEGSTTAGP